MFLIKSAKFIVACIKQKTKDTNEIAVLQIKVSLLQRFSV